jgi:hypothetical protein
MVEMGQRIEDDNGVTEFIDDNGVTCFVDDLGNYTCEPAHRRHKYIAVLMRCLAALLLIGADRWH